MHAGGVACTVVCQQAGCSEALEVIWTFSLVDAAGAVVSSSTCQTQTRQPSESRYMGDAFCRQIWMSRQVQVLQIDQRGELNSSPVCHQALSEATRLSEVQLRQVCTVDQLWFS